MGEDVRIKVSVIVPCYNAEKTLPACLGAINNSDYDNYELIVVDDGSTDGSLQIARQFSDRVIEIGENRGVTAARNQGAREASGEILLFVDSDIILRKDTISRLTEGFSCPETVVYQGVHSKIPANPGFGPSYVALEWHFNMAHNLGEGNIAECFFAECGAIRRDFFWKIGGFDEGFKGAGGEEFEISQRIMARTRIKCNPRIETDHFYQGIWGRTKTLFRRSPSYLEVMKRQRRFTRILRGNIFFGVVFSALGLISLLIALFIPKCLMFFPFFLAIGLLVNYRFFLFLLREKGVGFTLLATFPYWLFYLAIFLGLLLSLPAELGKPR